MKTRTYVPALLLLLGSQFAFSQRSLSAAVRPYAENWTYTMVNALHRAGFDMPTVSDKRPAPRRLQERNALQLDSTKTFYGYDAETGDSIPLSRTVYQYPFSNSKVETNYYYADGIWLPQNRALYVADDQERLIEVVAEIWNPEILDYQFDSHLEVFPHGDSPELIDSLATAVWDTSTNNWHVILTIGNTFDGDRLLQSNTSLYYFGSPVVFSDRYTYDANGDNVLIEEWGISEGEETPVAKTELTYVDHQPIEVTKYDTDGVNFFPYSRLNTSYMLFGAVRKELTFLWDVEHDAFKLSQTMEYFYDNEQRLAGTESVRIQPDAWDIKERVAYSYVQGDYLYMEWHFNWSDGLFDWILDTKKIYYYDASTAADPGPAAENWLKIWPNPATDIVQLDLKESGTVQVFDQTGRLVLSDRMQPGQSLRISGFPAGTYTFLAQQGAGVWQGKVMKQ
jgi:hypothetical protein